MNLHTQFPAVVSGGGGDRLSISYSTTSISPPVSAHDDVVFFGLSNDTKIHFVKVVPS